MAVYQIITQKAFNDGSHPGEEWANTFHVEATDIADALDKAGDVADVEKAIYWDNVSIVRLRVPGSGGGTGLFADVSIAGTRGGGDPATQLPLFNTAAVTFTFTGARRTVSHFRPPIDEADVEGGNLNSDVRLIYNDTLIPGLFALGYMVNRNGAAMAGGFVATPVHDRQTSSKRRSRPGFHRGWVPDTP